MDSLEALQNVPAALDEDVSQSLASRGEYRFNKLGDAKPLPPKIRSQMFLSLSPRTRVAQVECRPESLPTYYRAYWQSLSSGAVSPVRLGLQKNRRAEKPQAAYNPRRRLTTNGHCGSAKSRSL